MYVESDRLIWNWLEDESHISFILFSNFSQILYHGPFWVSLNSQILFYSGMIDLLGVLFNPTSLYWFRIPSDVFMSCQSVYAQINLQFQNAEEGDILQLVCLQRAALITQYVWQFELKISGTHKKKKGSWSWMTVISQSKSYFAHCTEKKAYLAHGFQWLPSRALDIWRS